MILKQFDGAAVAPRDDAILYNAIIKKNGVFKGVEITHIGSNQLHITAGHGILKGRVWEQEEETIHCNLATSGTLKGRAYIHMDLTDMDTPIKIMTVAAASLPELIQDEDCNYTNGIYEMELCTYDVTDLAISNLEVTYNNISEILPIIEKMTDLAALTEKGYVADALLVAELNKNMGGLTFGIDGDGNYGYYGADGSLVPFKSASNFEGVANVIAYKDNDGVYFYGGCAIDSNLIESCKYVIFKIDNHANLRYLYTDGGTGTLTNRAASLVNLGDNVYEYECIEGESFKVHPTFKTTAMAYGNAAGTYVSFAYCKFLPKKPS